MIIDRLTDPAVHHPASQPAPAANGWPLHAHVRLALALGIIGVVIALILFVRLPRSYTSSSAVVALADARGTLPGALASLGGSFGIGAGDATTSPQFTAELLTSRDVLASVVRRPFTVRDSGATTTLAEVLGASRPLTPEGISIARDALDASVSTSTDVRTGIVTLSVELGDPWVAQFVNAALVRAADSASSALRRGQAAAKRTFVEARLDMARRELADAEEAQRAFYQSNVLRSGPDLMLRDRRLQREVDMRQSVYSSLATDYEQALQEEARDTPSLSFFVTPDLPLRKSAPSGLLLVIAGGGVGVALATAIALLASGGTSEGPYPRSAGALVNAAARRIGRLLWKA